MVRASRCSRCSRRSGVLIVQEAGGVVCGFDGQPFDVRKGQLVAANPALLPHMLEVTRAR
jgi:fructose-1,6-bisphosphatase/inositol monophosphatase family enzyme